MKTIGIIGGIGPESTLEYYRSLISAGRDRACDGNYPHIIINSIDLETAVGLLEANDLDGLVEYFADAVECLARAGADFAAFAANTPHLVFDELSKKSRVPLISIVEATCRRAQELSLKRVGLFGTRFTMQNTFYQDEFEKKKISIVVPGAAEQDYIHDKYMNELVNGVMRDETRHKLLAIAEALREREAIEALILGGTELPLILTDETELGIPYLDTTQIHVASILDYAL
ncbi:MAG: amino acid racemase [Candidatus Krumholzibacteria bacterium]